MGIANFSWLLKKASQIKLFDSVLIDAQSLIYIAIDSSLKEEERQLYDDISRIVTDHIGKILTNLFSSKQFTDKTRVIISLDGSSVPMKIPIQQQRRNIELSKGRNIYKIALFGRNSISQHIYTHLFKSIQNFATFRKQYLKCKHLPTFLTFIFSNNDSFGEGEHKMFQLAFYYECQRPLIVSEDNDCFIIAYCNFTRFLSVQIKKKNNTLYDLNDMIRDHFQCSPNALARVSLLFGNDFLPPVIRISESNIQTVLDALKTVIDGFTLSELFHHVLNCLKDKKIRYEKVPYLDQNLIVAFFKTCLWVLDYYTFEEFPQKYMTNEIYHIFDRNALITAFLDLNYANEAFKIASTRYKNEITYPEEDLMSKVFSAKQIEQLKRFQPLEKEEKKSDVIDIIKKNQ